MARLEEKIDSLDKNMEKILFYMITDTSTNRKGFIEEIEELKKTLGDLLTERKIFKAQSTIMGMIGAALIAGLFKIGAIILPFLK